MGSQPSRAFGRHTKNLDKAKPSTRVEDKGVVDQKESPAFSLWFAGHSRGKLILCLHCDSSCPSTRPQSDTEHEVASVLKDSDLIEWKQHGELALCCQFCHAVYLSQLKSTKEGGEIRRFVRPFRPETVALAVI